MTIREVLLFESTGLRKKDVNIIRWKGKYRVVKNGTREKIPGTRDKYNSLQNAVKDMLMAIDDNFHKLSFSAKQEKVNKMIERDKELQKLLDNKKTKKRNGFEEVSLGE